MTAWDQSILLVISEPTLKQKILSELMLRRPAQSHNFASEGRRGRYQVSIAATVAEAIQHCASASNAPAVIVVDQSAHATAARGEAPLAAGWPRLHELAECAPVILMADASLPPPGGMSGLAELMARGRLELVARPNEASANGASFLPLVMALVERHARADLTALTPGDALWESFGEILRHELNNPLTGILGNAELLLARREQLSAAMVERLKTIAELAVRLRETVRRLSNAWEDYSGRPEAVKDEVEVNQ